MVFASPPARAALTDFEEQARPLVADPSACGKESRDLYDRLGQAWASMAQQLSRLPEGERPSDDEVTDAVSNCLSGLWAQHQPKLTDGNVVTRVYNRPSSIKSAYTKHMALAEAAAHAADAMGNTQYLTMHSPDRQYSQLPPPPDKEPPTGEPDLVDLIMGRLAGGANGGAAAPGLSPPGPSASGKGPGTGHSAQPVPTDLARAAKRLVDVGTVPLRCERLGPLLANSLLRTAPTFTEYAEKKVPSGAHGREAATLARALDLGVTESGVAFLSSSAAEVMVRRLVALVLATKMGSFVMAELLEELPGEHALAELPDALLEKLAARLKIQAKVLELSKK